MDKKWTKRWDSWIATRPSRPGVWRRKEGGFLVRGRARDPRTGKRREVKLRLDDVDAVTAYNILQQRLREISEGTAGPASTPPCFSDYSVSLLERKVRSGEIKSRKSRERWDSTLRLHLIPFFGALRVDAIRRTHILQWKDETAALLRAGRYSPTTANSWLAVLRVVVQSFVFELELPQNPISMVKDFDTREHHSYSEEQPNSLLPGEVPVFLAKMLELHPQHYAMVALGFGTGLRPSSLRPLRRTGEQADVLWDEGLLLVRRSHTRKQEVMQTTKTGQHQRLKLPAELMEILRWHVAQLTPKRSESELLFPPRWGDGFMSASALDKPFREVVAALHQEGKLCTRRGKQVIKKRITPRAMRRTFQDLARASEVKDIVTRAISGHVTEQMQRHYSSVSSLEVESGIARVISMARARELLRGKGSGAEQGADRGADRGAERGAEGGGEADEAEPSGSALGGRQG